MSVAASPQTTDFNPSPEIAFGLLLAAAIAWLQPFDLAFAAATFGMPALRAALIVVLALVGAGFADRLGLEILGPGDLSSLVFPVKVALLVAVFCAVIDRLFAHALHPAYLTTMTQEALGMRILGFTMRAFNENILYRLFLGSALAWALGRVWRRPDGRPSVGAIWAGFALAQAINVWVNVTARAPITPLALLHDGLRYFAPGMVWVRLFLRRGFRANEIASTSVHLFFQPIAGALLST